MKLTQNINSKLRNVSVYIFITMLPAFIISSILLNQRIDRLEDEYQYNAQMAANLQAKNIENFLGETVGRLDMLATLIKVQHNNIDNVDEILKETQRKDSRFSGFYWANPEGDLLISTNPILSAVNVSDRNYFKRALQSGETSFSDVHVGRVTGRKVVTIANPISDDSNNIKGVLLASLRLDHLESTLKNIADGNIILITDHNGEVLAETKSSRAGKQMVDANNTLSLVPWTVTAKAFPEEANDYSIYFFYYFAAVLFVLNLLYLLFHFIRLKQKVKKEMEQNEHQKLELVGNLAASTAHEIRNPLTGITGLIKLLSEENQDKKTQFYFDVIQKEIVRINAIVSELLVLGKPTAYTAQINNINDILREIEPIIQSEANFTNVELLIDYSSCELPVSCVKDQLKQVILNLSKNSLHAMPNGGELSISLERTGNYCIIHVKDNGAGIPEDVLSQVFNSFFTIGKDGSGLGLTVCKRIIETCGGTILIKSTLHKGTNVTIRIPLSLKEDN